MKFQKEIINIVATLILLNLVYAQNNTENTQKEEIVLTPGPITGNYNNNDLNEVYDESSIEIQCAGTTCTSSSDTVLLSEGKVTISTAGTYVFDGELNGQLNINATKDDLIHLVLRNATISSDFGPAVYSEKCKKLVVTTEGQNTISDSANYPEDASTDEAAEEAEDTENKSKSPNACIFISNNLTFNGKGTLNVNANFDEGIRSKKNLKFVSGKINVVSKGKAIKAKESISFKEAEVNIDAGTTGIKATKDTDPEEGFIVIDGGKIIVKSKKDGIHAETHLTINGGLVDITESDEGLEGQMIDITGGEIYVNSFDDGINASRIGSKGEGQPPPPPEPQISIDEDGNLTVTMSFGPPPGEYHDGNGQMPPPQQENYSFSTQTQTSSSSSGDNETSVKVTEDFEYSEYETDHVGEEVTLDAENDSECDVDDEECKSEEEETDIPNVTTIIEVPTEKVNDSIVNSNGSKKKHKNDNQVYIRITGGKLHVKVSGGDVDGIDSNGSLYIGGDAEVYVDDASGSIFGNMSAIDSSGTGIIDRYVTLFATGSGKTPPPPGSNENMTIEEVLIKYPELTDKQAQQYLEQIKSLKPPKPPSGGKGQKGPSNGGSRGNGGQGGNGGFPPPPPNEEPPSILQPYLQVSFENVHIVDTSIIIKNKEDEILIDHKPTTEFRKILFTSPNIVEGEVYSITAGDETITAYAQLDEEKSTEDVN